MFTMAVGNHDYYTNAATINAKNIYYNYSFDVEWYTLILLFYIYNVEKDKYVIKFF